MNSISRIEILVVTALFLTGALCLALCLLTEEEEEKLHIRIGEIERDLFRKPFVSFSILVLECRRKVLQETERFFDPAQAITTAIMSSLYGPIVCLGFFFLLLMFYGVVLLSLDLIGGLFIWIFSAFSASLYDIYAERIGASVELVFYGWALSVPCFAIGANTIYEATKNLRSEKSARFINYFLVAGCISIICLEALYIEDLFLIWLIFTLTWAASFALGSLAFVIWKNLVPKWPIATVLIGNLGTAFLFLNESWLLEIYVGLGGDLALAPDSLVVFNASIIVIKCVLFVIGLTFFSSIILFVIFPIANVCGRILHKVRRRKILIHRSGFIFWSGVGLIAVALSRFLFDDFQWALFLSAFDLKAIF